MLFSQKRNNLKNCLFLNCFWYQISWIIYNNIWLNSWFITKFRVKLAGLLVWVRYWRRDLGVELSGLSGYNFNIFKIISARALKYYLIMLWYQLVLIVNAALAAPQGRVPRRDTPIWRFKIFAPECIGRFEVISVFFNLAGSRDAHTLEFLI